MGAAEARTTGLSADMMIVNPIGFLTLTIWSWGIYFSPTARRQYQARHHGHLPQVSVSDLAFSLHALVISSITLGQVLYYAWKNKPKSSADDESRPLLGGASTAADLAVPTSTHKPSVVLQLSLAAMTVAAFVSAGLVWAGKAEFLDWLYLVSSLKLFISLVKYIPQVLLNYRLKSAEGLAIWVILLVSWRKQATRAALRQQDITGSFLSFAQLAVSAVFIEHDPSGIVANPAKLGLSLLSVLFDAIFIVQHYWLYPNRRVKDGEEEE